MMMNKILYKIIFWALFAAGFLVSCKKDIGNYDYKPINEIKFSGIDTINGYTVDVGETLTITPVVDATVDRSYTEANYTYEWALTNISEEETIISSSKNLAFVVTVKPASYILTYRIKDKTTGVTWQQRASLDVVTPVFEGYLILNNVGDTSRLDFISYRSATGVFTQYTNVPERLKQPFTPAGRPIQVSYNDVPSGAHIFLLNSTGTYRLDPETFGWLPELTVPSMFLGTVPAGLKADKILGKFNANFGEGPVWFYENGNIYSSDGFRFNSIPFNSYKDFDDPAAKFKMAPFRFASDLSNFNVYFDETNRRFVLFSRNVSQQSCSPVDESLGFPEGKDLVYMTDNNVLMASGENLYGYAILKDPGLPNYHMLRMNLYPNPFFFSPGLRQDYFEPIVSTDFDKAEQYAVSPELGYLFYAVGGKIYEYDLFLKTGKLMLDMGNKKISLMKFDADASGDFGKWLMVGCYDPSGEEGGNGTFGLYAVPPLNAPLELQQEWTGFGKIVSASYRFR
jgi:hypothetical protein